MHTCYGHCCDIRKTRDILLSEYKPVLILLQQTGKDYILQLANYGVNLLNNADPI